MSIFPLVSDPAVLTACFKLLAVDVQSSCSCLSVALFLYVAVLSGGFPNNAFATFIAERNATNWSLFSTRLS